jgi:hypothetical protein
MKKKGVLLLILLLYISEKISAQATWVYFDPNNKLVYKTDSKGNRIMDFSYAGYMGGGITLPTIAVKVTVNAASGDRTAAIQNAINQVAALPLTAGVRGAVLLGPGTFNISGTLNINASGIVVRGSGSGNGGTVINMTGTTGFLCFNAAGSGSYSTSGTVNITNSFIPSGTNSFTVSNASGFQVGNTVLIYRPVTQAWVDFMQMDSLWRSGAQQTWLSVGSKITTDRIITAISGNQITVDAPLTDSFDATYLGNPVGTFAKYTFAGRISQVGIEHLKIQAPSGTTAYNAVTMDDIIDSWVQDVIGQETQNAFNVNKNAKRITLDKVINNISVTQTATARSGDYSITGTQILLNKCQSNGTGTWAFICSSTGTGPIVLLNCVSNNTSGLAPHQRWTTGVLADNCSMPKSTTSNSAGISFINRKTEGSGHGWCTGWSVAWNVTCPNFAVQNAPGTLNWVIGGNGSMQNYSPNGIYDHFKSSVMPCSLYLQQLEERSGANALTNIGYGPNCGNVATEINTPQDVAVFGLQSYPNPFDQRTDIVYTLPEAGNTKAVIYDMNGREIETLVNEYQTAGDYKYDWDASNANNSNTLSGIYILKITSGNHSGIVKLVLIK